VRGGGEGLGRKLGERFGWLMIFGGGGLEEGKREEKGEKRRDPSSRLIKSIHIITEELKKDNRHPPQP